MSFTATSCSGRGTETSLVTLLPVSSGVQMLTNQKQGHYYGTLVNWPAARRRRLGVYLLYRALLIFLAEGERELQPQDIQARG